MQALSNAARQLVLGPESCLLGSVYWCNTHALAPHEQQSPTSVLLSMIPMADTSMDLYMYNTRMITESRSV